MPMVGVKVVVGVALLELVAAPHDCYSLSLFLLLNDRGGRREEN